MRNILLGIVVGILVLSTLPIMSPILDQGMRTGLEVSRGGQVYYMMPTHHVESLEEANIGKSIINAVQHMGEGEDPIDVLVYSNIEDRGAAIMEHFKGLGIHVILQLTPSSLLNLDGYDVVIIHSNGARLTSEVEQSVKDYVSNGGNVIGSHDVIWAQFDNPILEEVFGATAVGDGGNPGMGWFHGDFDVCIVPGHPIVEGLDNCWRLYDDDFFFDVIFKRDVTILWQTSWQGEMVPVAWTFSTGPEDIEAEVTCHPESLNTWSMGNWITCYIELPEGYDPKNIDPDTILLNGELKPVLDPKYDFVTDETEYITDNDNDNIPERMVKFDRFRIQNVLPLGVDVELTIAGFLYDGTRFDGHDGIRHFEPMVAMH